MDANRAPLQLVRRKASENIVSLRRRRGDFAKGRSSKQVAANQDSVRHFADRDTTIHASTNTSQEVIGATMSIDRWDCLSSTILQNGRVDVRRPLQRQDHQLCYAPVPCWSLEMPYERTMARFQVDVRDLSMLTNFNVGQATIPILACAASSLASLMGHQQWFVHALSPLRYKEFTHTGPSYNTYPPAMKLVTAFPQLLIACWLRYTLDLQLHLSQQSSL